MVWSMLVNSLMEQHIGVEKKHNVQHVLCKSHISYAEDFIVLHDFDFFHSRLFLFFF